MTSSRNTFIPCCSCCCCDDNAAETQQQHENSTNAVSEVVMDRDGDGLYRTDNATDNAAITATTTATSSTVLERFVRTIHDRWLDFETNNNTVTDQPYDRIHLNGDDDTSPRAAASESTPFSLPQQILGIDRVTTADNSSKISFPLRLADSVDSSGAGVCDSSDSSKNDVPVIHASEIVLPGSALQKEMAKALQAQLLKENKLGNDEDADEDYENECVVCMEEFDTTNPRMPTNCGCGTNKTYFHLPCLYQYMDLQQQHQQQQQSNETDDGTIEGGCCPSCRQPLTWDEL